MNQVYLTPNTINDDKHFHLLHYYLLFIVAILVSRSAMAIRDREPSDDAGSN